MKRTDAAGMTADNPAVAANDQVVETM